jgi:hypothetical protein
MRCIGGPAHDRWYNVRHGERQWAIAIPLEVSMRIGRRPDVLAEISFDQTVYSVERLIWPGWRFPLRVLVAPGVQIKGHPQAYDSSWPNPLVRRRCRCNELGSWTVTNARVHSSACHLDHCPIHGRWTFPPMTPMGVSLQARALWLHEQQQSWMFEPDECPNRDHPFEHQCGLCGYDRASRKRGLETGQDGRHTPSTATEPDSNRAHTE